MTMRSFFIVAFLGNIVFALGSLPWLPDGFDASVADAMDTCIAVSILAVSLFVLSSKPVLSMPIGWRFLPNHDYWMDEENRPKAIQRARFSLEIMGVEAMLVILFIQWEVWQINRTVQSELVFSYRYYVVGVFFVALVFEQVRLYRSFFHVSK